MNVYRQKIITMKHRLFLLQYKMQIGALLTVLITTIIINCIYSKKNIDHMEASVTSIYNDRLLASTYISELTHHLYEQKVELNNPHSASDLQHHAKEISSLILKFENTVLTKQEVLHWKAFKKHLVHYNQGIALGNTGEKELKMALENLKLLTRIQAKEGNVIFQDIRTDISSSLIGWSLEISLSIIIGLVVLTLIGISKTTLLMPRQNPSLN
jgi:hypothetical protein